jgi:hypothetical protein
VRLIFYILLFKCFVVCIFNEPASGKEPGNPAKKALHIVKRNAVLVVANKGICRFRQGTDYKSAPAWEGRKIRFFVN